MTGSYWPGTEKHERQKAEEARIKGDAEWGIPEAEAIEVANTVAVSLDKAEFDAERFIGVDITTAEIEADREIVDEIFTNGDDIVTNGDELPPGEEVAPSDAE